MSIMEKYEIGLPTFKAIFQLQSAQIREIVNQICGDKIPNEELLKQGAVKKVTSDDEPQSLEIAYYDSVSISPFGITYNPEHGEGKQLVEFNKYFTLNTIV